MAVGYEFIIITSLYNEVEEELVLIKEDIATKWFCTDLTLITEVEEVYDDKGDIKPDYSKIVVGGEERLVLKSYKEMKKLITTKSKIGF